MLGYIILENLPVEKLEINGHTMKIDEDFTGFRLVPPGNHQVTYQVGDLVQSESVTLESGEVVARTFNEKKELLVPTEVEEEILEKIKSGELIPYLEPFPAEAYPDEDDEGENLLRALASPAKGDKTDYSDEELIKFERAFLRLFHNAGDNNFKVYFDYLKRNYVEAETMAKHLDYYLRFIDRVINHLVHFPLLAHSPARLYFDFIRDDLTELEEDYPQVEKTAHIYESVLERAEVLASERG